MTPLEAHVAPQLARIPLAYLTLCLDCDTAYSLLEARTCPACGSQAGLTLSRVLDRGEKA